MVDRGDIKVVIYLDDIIVFGDCPKRVWLETCLVLERLVLAGFMINVSKSKFLV